MNQILRDIYRKQTSTLGKKYTFDDYALVYEDENCKVCIKPFEPSDFLQAENNASLAQLPDVDNIGVIDLTNTLTNEQLQKIREEFKKYIPNLSDSYDTD